MAAADLGVEALFLDITATVDRWFEAPGFWMRPPQSLIDCVQASNVSVFAVDETWAFRLDAPDHILNRAFGGKGFKLRDEIYQFKNWQPEKVHVLMSLNMEKTKLKKPYHVPIAWVKNYGDGKVMHMSLGHREDVWTNEIFQRIVLGGIAWALGNVDADIAPNIAAVTPKANQLSR